MDLTVLDEPLIEFGYGGTHPEQRAGLTSHGPADMEMDGRKSSVRIGVVGPGQSVEEIERYLKACARGLVPKDGAHSALFPDFPGCSPNTGFRTRLTFPKAGKRTISTAATRALRDATTDADRLKAAVELCGTQVRGLLERADVDVVVVARPPGVPEGVVESLGVGADFHDLLKANVIGTRRPIQIIREKTWKGSGHVEDPATRAWNLFTALFYKAEGKPWRLHTNRHAPTRCYVGVSFARADDSPELHTTVAQVFNEMGDGVIVQGALARRSEHDLQPHLTRADAEQLLLDALDGYHQEHETLPAAVTLHKTSSFSDDEREGFMAALRLKNIARCDLVWLSNADDAMVIRNASYFPPLRGTLLTLAESEHILYVHGSVPYYRAYPGLHVPHPLAVRPCVADRSIEEIASEIMALSKLNWNRARIDGRWPITLLTARRVGHILRHVPADAQPATRYAHYM